LSDFPEEREAIVGHHLRIIEFVPKVTMNLFQYVFGAYEPVRVDANIDDRPADSAESESRHKNIAVQDHVHEMTRSRSSSEVNPAARANGSDYRQRS